MATASTNSDGESKGPVNEGKVAVFDSDGEEMVRWLLKRANLSPLLRGNVPTYEELTDAQKETFGEFLKVPECRRILCKFAQVRIIQYSVFTFVLLCPCNVFKLFG